MKILELFSGSGIMSKTFRDAGHETVTLDTNYPADISADILKFPKWIMESATTDVIWASPPCTTFSVASIGTHWKGGKGIYEPKTDACKKGLEMLNMTIKIIASMKPKYWFIENPRGVMRKVIEGMFADNEIPSFTRHTVCYCRYGEKRMKPTDIWTNCSNWKPIDKMCHNGNPDHEPAPRGSKTGTQGLKNNFERSKLPKELCKEIVKSCALSKANETIY